MLTPFENQKHACPFFAERFLGLCGAISAEGKGHHGWKGTGNGTPDVAFHGLISESIAFRGGGNVAAPCAICVRCSATRKRWDAMQFF